MPFMPFFNYFIITPPPFWRRWSRTFFTVALAVAISVFLRILASINFRLVSLFAVIGLPEEQPVDDSHCPRVLASQMVAPESCRERFVSETTDQGIHQLIDRHQDLEAIRMPH